MSAIDVPETVSAATAAALLLEFYRDIDSKIPTVAALAAKELVKAHRHQREHLLRQIVAAWWDRSDAEWFGSEGRLRRRIRELAAAEGEDKAP